MRSALPSFLACFSILIPSNPLHPSEESRKEYLELLRRYPALTENSGDSTKGEIEIVLDPEEMASIEKATGRDVGLIKMDKYWLWLNDACRFPNGTKGVYGRIMWVRAIDSSPGIAVMPIMPDGRIALNCNFRHATRSWEIELPRGLIDAGETPEQAARRETLEETGMVVGETTLLGQICPDTGLTSSLVPVYAARVTGERAPQRDDAEAIEDVLLLKREEALQALSQGYLEREIRGVAMRIPLRDPFLAFALLLAK